MMNFVIEPIVAYKFEEQKLMLAADEYELGVRIISSAQFLASEFDRDCVYYSYSPIGLLLLNHFLHELVDGMLPKNVKLDGFIVLTYPFSMPQVNHMIDCTVASLMEMINPSEDYHNFIPIQEGYFEIELSPNLYKISKESVEAYEKKIEKCYQRNKELFEEVDHKGHILAVLD